MGVVHWRWPKDCPICKEIPHTSIQLLPYRRDLDKKRRQFTISKLLLTIAQRTAGAVRMTGNMQFPSDSPLAILIGAGRTATVSQFRDTLFSYSRVLISDTTGGCSEIQNFNSRVHL